MIELRGRPISDEILADLKEKIAKERVTPGLAVVLVGENKASAKYVELKRIKAKEIGVKFYLYYFKENSEEEEVLSKIKELNKEEAVHGIIVQLPLPAGFDAEKVIGAISPQKDVDGFHFENMEKFKKREEIFWPVFPKAILRMITEAGEDFSGKKGVAVVNSEIFGETMKIAMERIGINVEYVLERDMRLNLDIIKSADIIVSAVGKPRIIDGEMVKAGVLIIDGGISSEKSKTLGDVNLKSVSGKVGTVTPVPGGVGPVTIACLLENVYIAYKNQLTK